MIQRVGIYDKDLHVFLCNDCILDFYEDDLPGMVKHGGEQELAEWLATQPDIEVLIGKQDVFCDRCGREF